MGWWEWDEDGRMRSRVKIKVSCREKWIREEIIKEERKKVLFVKWLI